MAQRAPGGWLGRAATRGRGAGDAPRGPPDLQTQPFTPSHTEEAAKTYRAEFGCLVAELAQLQWLGSNCWGGQPPQKMAVCTGASPWAHPLVHHTTPRPVRGKMTDPQHLGAPVHPQKRAKTPQNHLGFRVLEYNP